MALALVSTGCASTSPGEPVAVPAPAPARIPDEPAIWAVTQLDACKLLPGTSLAEFNPRPAYPMRPHHCARELELPGVGHTLVTVGVGTLFRHFDRLLGEPVTIGGLVAYQRVNVDSLSPDCVVDLPLSATASIQFSSRTTERTTNSGCVTTRAMATDAVSSLRDLGSVRRTPGKSLADWRLCELMSRALAVATEDSVPGETTPDKCRSTGSYDEAIRIEVIAGPEPVTEMRANPQVHGGVTAVQLTGVEATQSGGSTRSCDLAWAQEPSGSPNPRLAVQQVKFQAKTCTAAVEAANKIRAALAGTPPPPPPAPARLGFPAGTNDENTDPACQVVGSMGTEVEDCRTPHPVPVPTGVDAIVTAADRPEGPDVACAMLASALRATTGQEPIIAAYRTTCVGAPKDFTVSVQLIVFPHAPATAYCLTPSERHEISLAGKPAFTCRPNGKRHELTIGLRGSLDTPGVLLIHGMLNNPRGVSMDPPDDAERITVVDRIAEHVVNQYFAK